MIRAVSLRHSATCRIVGVRRGIPCCDLCGVDVCLRSPHPTHQANISLQTMLTMKHVAPFARQANMLRTRLSNTSDTLEQWAKVQTLWSSLESVFLGGDIARQMPVVARRFQRVDRDWARVMAAAVATEFIVEACSNLPAMFGELERCQNNLEGYLEQKRSRFARFYFVSDPVLLQILSQGSDPQVCVAGVWWRTQSWRRAVWSTPLRVWARVVFFSF